MTFVQWPAQLSPCRDYNSMNSPVLLGFSGIYPCLIVLISTVSRRWFPSASHTSPLEIQLEEYLNFVKFIFCYWILHNNAKCKCNLRSYRENNLKANKCGYMRHTDVEGVAGNPQKGIWFVRSIVCLSVCLSVRCLSPDSFYISFNGRWLWQCEQQSKQWQN